ncbi:riboflavin kinase [Halolamina pelagica]|uniref:Riboflavin kinase n=1 Tax=Halolamina pelagica TaxID=699431 RepID=A0A0P7GMI4_9EURY|nr:riboflavin kinase [Halolamina pelagica]
MSCAALGDRLGASSQTASRRLQRLESADLIEREVVADGQWIALTTAGKSRLREEYADYRRLFEDDAALTLSGGVTAGAGEGRHYISLPGYNRQFEARLGYDPYPGTLNVELDEESTRNRSELAAVEGVPIDEWEDEERTYGSATCYPARLEADAGGFEPVHVIVPDRTHHDEDKIELIAPEMLRDELGLADGDEVVVEIEEA